MTLADYRQTLVEMAFFSQATEQLAPSVTAFTSVHERLSVADHDEGIPCSRKHHSHAFRRGHKSYIVRRVAPGEREDDNIAFFSLVVIWERSVTA